MPILDQSSCDTYLNGGAGGPSYETVLCIGDGADSKVKSLIEQKSRYVSFIQGTCFGDSGGPFIVQKEGETRLRLDR